MREAHMEYIIGRYLDLRPILNHCLREVFEDETGRG